MLLAAAPLHAAAQGAVAASAVLEVPALLRIDVSGSDVAFPTPAADDFATGWILASSPAPRVHTRGNVPHRVQVAAAAPHLQGAAGATKPVTDLQWSDDGLAWIPMDTRPADLALLPPGQHPDAAPLRFRLLLDLAADRPDTYDVTLVFTAVAQ